MGPPDTEVLRARRAMVVGLGVTGTAVTRCLVARDVGVLVVDDHPSEATVAAARSLPVDLLSAPSDVDLDAALAGVDLLLPSPGVPDRHPVFALAARRGVPVRSEFDLAAAWDDRPLVAITGTDGKTTVTTMVTEMLVASGVRAVDCGNTDVPLVEAIADPATEVFVVEASSFRLGHTHRFQPAVATWLNFAPDHLDVHASLDAYEAAKAKIWADLDDNAVAVVNVDDPVVRRHRPSTGRVITFGLEASGRPDTRIEDGNLLTADGEILLPVAELARAQAHDLANALAASATALAAGADTDAVRSVLRTFRGLAHRVQLVASNGGISWFDDSKATSPHATLAAVEGFESVVLLAGGRNKGLDLSALSGTVPPVRAVVALGEAADEIRAAFVTSGVDVVTVASGMGDAVDVAAHLARPGDTVLLSPGCTSFDWFGSYAERGDAFVEAVRARLGDGGATS